MKVNYFFVGPRKTGTSWLDFYLNKVSKIGMPYTRKELHFFNMNISKGLNWYHNNFRQSFKYYGDCSATYFTSSDALKNIKQYNKDAKIVITIRNPFNRAISHFKMDREHNGDISWENFLCSSSFKDSFYYEQIKLIYSLFNKNQVIIIKYEELFNSDCKELVKLNKFLNMSIDNKVMSELQSIKVYEDKGTPKNRFLYFIARRVLTFLYHIRLRWLIELFFKLGIKGIFYKKDNFNYKNLDFTSIREKLNHDIIKTQDLISKYKVSVNLEDYIVDKSS